MIVTSETCAKFELCVGTEIFVHCSNRARGGHGAWMTVTKLNKKTFNAVEDTGSYSPGTNWNIHLESKFAIVERPEGKGWIRHWINDI